MEHTSVEQPPISDRPVIREDAVMSAAFAAVEPDAIDASQSQRGMSLRPRMGKELLEEIYRIPIFQRICSARPTQAILKGWQLTLGGKQANSKVPGDFAKYSKKLKIPQKFCQAQILANIYGGAALLINADDGKHWSEPLDKTKIRTIRNLVVLDRHKIQPLLLGTTALLDPTEPEYYQLLVPLGEKEQAIDRKIHHSRVIRFDGIMLPPDVMIREFGWGMSLIEAIYTDYDNWSRGLNATVRMLEDFSLFIYKMAQLKELVAEQDEELIAARIRTLRQGIKSMGGAVIDSNGEDISFANRQFAGIDGVSDKLRDAFIGATGIPHDKMFGESPSGLGATGESEEKNWSSDIAAFQEFEWRHKLEHLIEIVLLAQDGPSKGKEVEDWGLKFVPLRQETQQEAIQNRSSQAQTDNTYFQMGVLLPEEIRNTRFGSSEYNFETNLDNKLWEENKKKAEEQQQFNGFEDFGGENGTASAESGDEEAIAPEDASEDEEPKQDSLVDTPDELAQQGLTKSSPIVADLLSQLKSWIDNCDSYDEIQQGIPELYDKLDADRFAQIVFEQNMLAQLSGMSDVQNEVAV